MSDLALPEAYGTLTEPATLTIQRILPGPVERVWAYITQSDLRRRWLAAGPMNLAVGAPFELVWRNDELTTPPGARPAGFPDEHRMQSQITELDPPRRIAFTWGSTSGVTIELETRGDSVLLTLVHRRLPERPVMLNISAGWHAHLDILAAALSDQAPEPFWDHWLRLKEDYDRRLPA